MSYENLGHEGIYDLITLCDNCHDNFHKNWQHKEYFKEQDEDHWERYSLIDTAKLCGQYLNRDYWFGGDLICTNPDVRYGLIDEYYKENEISTPNIIRPEDIELYFSRKRYEVLFFEEEHRPGFVLDKAINPAIDDFLDEKFGKKGGKGGNPKRADARQFILRHSWEGFHRNYWYLKHINYLMKEAKKYEQT